MLVHSALPVHVIVVEVKHSAHPENPMHGVPGAAAAAGTPVAIDGAH